MEEFQRRGDGGWNRLPSGMSHREDARHAEIQILRRMTPEQKISVMNGLILQAVKMKESSLRLTRPELSGSERSSEAWRLVTRSGG